MRHRRTAGRSLAVLALAALAAALAGCGSSSGGGVTVPAIQPARVGQRRRRCQLPGEIRLAAFSKGVEEGSAATECPSHG